jgi:hypothetical protein
MKPVSGVGQRPLVQVEDREQDSGHGAGGETEIAPSLRQGPPRSYGEASDFAGLKGGHAPRMV